MIRARLHRPSSLSRTSRASRTARDSRTPRPSRTARASRTSRVFRVDGSARTDGGAAGASWRLLAALAVLLAAGAAESAAPQYGPALAIEAQRSGTAELLQAISVVDERVVWVAGHGGTFGRTLDGGVTWKTAVVPDAAELQFRDVHAVDADTAYLMSAGHGDASRVFRTDDGGTHWTLQLTNPDPEGFWDCFDFWDPDRGILYGDSLADGLVVYRTDDGGETWDRVPPDNLPEAQEGEGGFAASGTCLVTGPGGRAWIGTGAATTARVLRTDDAGAHWSVAPVPVVSGSAAGITTLAFRDERHGMALGGDVADHELRQDNVAVTHDGGRSWDPASRPQMSGAVYGAAWIPDSEPPTLVAVGPRGLEITGDDGSTWRHVANATRWAVAFASPDAGWAVGPEGRIDRLRLLQWEDTVGASRLQGLAFLAGHWRGTFEGNPYEEIYSTPQGGKVLWLSKTYAEGNVVGFEFGTIDVVDGQVVLTPYVNGQASDAFTLVELGSSPPVAVFANPEHDFPTRLEYRLLERDHLRIVLKGPDGDSGPVLTAELRRRAG